MSLLAPFINIYYSFVESKNVNQAFGLIETLGLDQDLKNRQWTTFDNKIEQLSNAPLSRIIDGFCFDVNYTNTVQDYIDNHESEVRNLIAGVFFVRKAWDSRTAQRAAAVTDEQWEGFIDYLEQARYCLSSPYDNPILQAQALAERLNIHRGLGEREEADETFARCMELDPQLITAHIIYAKILTPRWLGSEEEMFDFVNVQQGDNGLLVQLMYLTDTYLVLVNDDDELAKRAFQRRYKPMYTKWLKDFEYIKEDTVISIQLGNYLAFVANAFGHSKERDRILKLLQNNITTSPWAYLGIHNKKDIMLFKLAGWL